MELRKTMLKIKNKFISVFVTLCWLFATPAFAEFSRVLDNFYVDFSKIKKKDGYRYFWTMVDYGKSDQNDEASIIFYSKGDCQNSRFEIMQFISYREPMGSGFGERKNIEQKWTYPPPDSNFEVLLNSVCRH